MGKTGTIWHFVCDLFPSTWRTLSPDALFTRIQDTHANTQMSVLSLLVSRSTHPRNAYFSWQTLNCQIVPVLPSHLGTLLSAKSVSTQRFGRSGKSPSAQKGGGNLPPPFGTLGDKHEKMNHRPPHYRSTEIIKSKILKTI